MHSRKIIKNTFFVIYIIVFFIYAIKPSPFADTRSTYEYFCEFSNFIPLTPIIDMFKDYFSGNLNLNILIKNVLGNIIYFMPFAYLLHNLYNKKNTVYIISLIIIIGFEICQIIFKSGSFDINDIILNFIGVIIIKTFLNKRDSSKQN